MKRSLALALALAITLPFAAACAVDAPTEAAEDAVTTPVIVGKYAFVWDGARKAEVYAELEKKLSGAELDAAKRDADKEAAESWIEFGADGTFRSYIGDKEIATQAYAVEAEDDDSTVIAMKGKTARIRFLGESKIVIPDPGKGELTFERM